MKAAPEVAHHPYTGRFFYVCATSYEIGHTHGTREARNYWLPVGLCLGTALGAGLVTVLFWIGLS